MKLPNRPFKVVSGQTWEARPEIDPNQTSLLDGDGMLIATLNRNHPTYEANVRLLKGIDALTVEQMELEY
jgi:hypothetical protein